MMKRVLLSAFIAALVASSATAATVTLSLVKDPSSIGCTGCTLSGPGTYQLYAEASQGDNFGISAFNIPVLGVSSIFNRSPRALIDPDDQAASAGFTSVRSGNNGVAIPGGFALGGGQDNVTPTPFLIRGFGQEASSFSAKVGGLTVASPQTQTSWAAKLLLAEGSYLAGSTPSIDLASVEVGVNVFLQGSGIATAPAILAQPSTNLPPVVGDKAVDWFSQNPGVVNSDTLPLTDDAPAGGVWTIQSFTPPNGIAPSINPSTGVFSWLGNGTPGGTYPAVLKFTDAGGLADTGTLAITWHVPEPTSLMLFGLAMAGFAGFRRKK